MKKQFITMYDDRVRRTTNAGTAEAPVYGPVRDKVDNRSCYHLEVTGYINTYDKIQSYKDSADIHEIIKRFEAGDTEALMRAQSYYADMTQIPTDMVSFIDVAGKAKTIFDAFDVDTRRKYNHDFNTFLSAFGTPEFLSDCGYSLPVNTPVTPVVTPESEVVTE